MKSSHDEQMAFEARQVDEALLQRARAYETVFGQAGARSVDQERVWEDLQRVGFALVPVSMNSRDREGRIDLLKLAENAGKNAFYLNIEANLRLAAAPPEWTEEPNKQ